MQLRRQIDLGYETRVLVRELIELEHEYTTRQTGTEEFREISRQRLAVQNEIGKRMTAEGQDLLICDFTGESGYLQNVHGQARFTSAPLLSDVRGAHDGWPVEIEYTIPAEAVTAIESEVA